MQLVLDSERLGGRRSEAMGVFVGVAVGITSAVLCSRRVTPGRSVSSRRDAAPDRRVILMVHVEARQTPVHRSVAGSGARPWSRQGRSGHAT